MVAAVETQSPREYALAMRAAIGRKFEASDLMADNLLVKAATEFMDSDEYLSGDDMDTFLRNVRQASKGRWGASPAMLKGVLNVMCVREKNAQEHAAVVAEHPQGIQAVVPNSYYTVVFRDEDYVTLQVCDDFRKGQPEGAQMAKYLYGSNNVRNYRGFAWVKGDQAVLWNKLQSASHVYSRQMAALSYLMKHGTRAQEVGRENYALEYSHCARCRKALTVPISLHRGVGPECAKILGIA